MASKPAPGQRHVVYFHNGDSYGGMEKNTLLLLRYLDQNRFRASVVMPAEFFFQLESTARFRDEVAALDVPILAAEPKGSPVTRLRGLFASIGTDVLHIQTSEAFSARAATVAAWSKQIPVLRTEHIPPSSYASGESGRITRLCDRLTEMVIVDSDANLEDQAQVLGRSRSKLHRSYTGIEIEPLRRFASRADAKKAIGIDPNTPVVGTIGRLTEQKGTRFVIEAMPAVLERRPDVCFVIVGNGELEAQLRQHAADLGVSDHVHFAGFQADYIPYISAFDVGVMPSLWEGFSLSMLEFMALGTPMVFSDHPSFTEAVVHEESALIVPMADGPATGQAILRLLNDDDLAKKLSYNVAERVETDYSIERLSNEMMALYDAALA